MKKRLFRQPLLQALSLAESVGLMDGHYRHFTAGQRFASLTTGFLSGLSSYNMNVLHTNIDFPSIKTLICSIGLSSGLDRLLAPLGYRHADKPIAEINFVPFYPFKRWPYAG